MTLPSIEKIVSNYLYGQDSPPTDFVDGSFATARKNCEFGRESTVLALALAVAKGDGFQHGPAT